MTEITKQEKSGQLKDKYISAILKKHSLSYLVPIKLNIASVLRTIIFLTEELHIQRKAVSSASSVRQEKCNQCNFHRNSKNKERDLYCMETDKIINFSQLWDTQSQWTISSAVNAKLKKK